LVILPADLKEPGVLMDKKWGELSPDEKREERFKRWLWPPDVKFVSPEAEKAYRERVARFVKVIKLDEPDRVPCLLPAAFFPAYYAGITLQTAIYDYDELRRAWLKFLHEFDMDAYNSPGFVLPGKVFDDLDYKIYKWPGHGLSPDVPSYQFVEGEYMKADEYDALIRDPSDFWMRVYMPRIFGALEPFRKLTPFTDIIEIPTAYFIAYTRPDVQAALQALIDAGRETAKWLEAVDEVNLAALEAGYPSFWSGFAKAPFDTIGDTLRGTQGIITDMYRRPDKLMEAMERITPLTVESAVASANASGVPSTMIPLHKGADAFMSSKQFETFYWPSLKKVVLGMINEGIVPMLFAEGSYNQRLEIVKDLPRGAVIWYFDQTDMARAKEVLGDTACIAGNVPVSILCTGTPQAVKEYCRKLIEVCGKGGGYILTGGASIDEGNPDNLRAMMAAAREYGVYQ
jgi:uroporphyrinogen-III decarboxylase